MVEDYYASKEFKEYVENVDNDIESVLSYEEWHRNRDAMAEQFKIDEINDSLELKYTDNDILNILDLFDIQPPIRDSILKAFNRIWNNKRGF